LVLPLQRVQPGVSGSVLARLFVLPSRRLFVLPNHFLESGSADCADLVSSNGEHAI